MARVWKDSRGKVMEVGDRVAFNRSGDVIEGEIWALCPAHVKIEPAKEFGRYSSGPSKVRNATSILILAEGD